MKKILLMLTLLSVIVAGCASNSPKIELSTDKFDMGDIDPDAGLRTETFFVKNVGGAALNIESVSTSCGCTEAEVESEQIAPGEQTKLTVTYDPSVHPGLTGKIIRKVYIKSDDPSQGEVELTLIGNSLPSDSQSDKDKGKSDHDAGLMENFEISPHALNEKIASGESFKLLDVREDFEYEENHIKGTSLLSVNNISQESLDDLGLEKDDEIIVYCRSGGRSAKAYKIMTELGYANVKSMNGGIIHWIEEGFPIEEGVSNEVQKESNEGSPSISFDRIEHDFGEITQFGGTAETTFQVMNEGDIELRINSISTSCGCTSAKIDDQVILPGKSATLTVTFDPDFHREQKGRFSRTVFIKTNDPSTPEAEVKIWADIIEGQ
ncbi:MAG: DUF1573 domain-containing protein [Candidatus Nanoarchaeia archaeon]